MQRIKRACVCISPFFPPINRFDRSFWYDSTKKCGEHADMTNEIYITVVKLSIHNGYG